MENQNVQSQQAVVERRRKKYQIPAIVGTGGVFRSFVLKSPKNGAIFGTVVKNFDNNEPLNPILNVPQHYAGILTTVLPKIFGEEGNGIAYKIQTNKFGNLSVLADIPLPEGMRSAIFMKPATDDQPIVVVKRNKVDINNIKTTEVNPGIKSIIEASGLNLNFVQLNEFDFILSVQYPKFKEIIMPSLNTEMEIDPHLHNSIGLIQAIWPELGIRFKTVSEGDSLKSFIMCEKAPVPWSGYITQIRRSNDEPGVLKSIEVCPD